MVSRKMVQMYSCVRLWVYMSLGRALFVQCQRKASSQYLEGSECISMEKESAGILAITLFVPDHFEFMLFFYSFESVQCSFSHTLTHACNNTLLPSVFHLNLSQQHSVRYDCMWELCEVICSIPFVRAAHTADERENRSHSMISLTVPWQMWMGPMSKASAHSTLKK